jgi:hypothetical protein
MLRHWISSARRCSGPIGARTASACESGLPRAFFSPAPSGRAPAVEARVRRSKGRDGRDDAEHLEGCRVPSAGWVREFGTDVYIGGWQVAVFRPSAGAKTDDLAQASAEVGKARKIL